MTRKLIASLKKLRAAPVVNPEFIDFKDEDLEAFSREIEEIRKKLKRAGLTLHNVTTQDGFGGEKIIFKYTLD